MRYPTSSFPLHPARALIGALLLTAACSAFAFTPINDSFSGTTLSPLLMTGGQSASHTVNDGITLTTGTANYIRSWVGTAANDYTWVGSSDPVTYAFTLDSFSGAVNSINLVLVGNNDPIYTGATPDYSPAHVLGIQLIYSSATDDYTLNLYVKPNSASAGFSGVSFGPKLSIKGIAASSLIGGTFGFTIDPVTNQVVLEANAVQSTTSYTLDPTVVSSYFGTNAAAYLGVTNSNTGASATAEFSRLMIGTASQIPEPSTVALAMGACALVGAGFVIRKRRLVR